MQNPNDGTLQKIPKGVPEKFKDGTPVPANVALFRVGQELEINGGRFRIRKITKKDLILRGIRR